MLSFISGNIPIWFSRILHCSNQGSILFRVILIFDFSEYYILFYTRYSFLTPGNTHIWLVPEYYFFSIQGRLLKHHTHVYVQSVFYHYRYICSRMFRQTKVIDINADYSFNLITRMLEPHPLKNQASANTRI